MRYVLVLGGLLVTVFAIRTAIVAFRSTIRHPWWWAFVCLLCAPVTTFDVAAGQLSTDLLSVTMFGLGYWQGPPGQATFIQVGFPAGALLFLHRRRKLVSAFRPMLPEDRLPP